MLPLLTDYGVPAAIAFLMLIAGTELSAAHIKTAVQHPRALLLGTLCQLAFLPPLALLINAGHATATAISTGTLLLALSPGGGISNYYCYLAHRNVSLSAAITAFGTVLSLVTIPLWMKVLHAFFAANAAVQEVPTRAILLQLFALMILPMAGGMLLRKLFPKRIEAGGALLRTVSLGFVLLILVLVISATRSTALNLGPGLIAAALFVVGAMLCGWVSGLPLTGAERDVVVIESGVRNIGVALILSRLLFPLETFGLLASFFAAYFAVEIIIMLAFARRLSRQT